MWQAIQPVWWLRWRESVSSTVVIDADGVIPRDEKKHARVLPFLQHSLFSAKIDGAAAVVDCVVTSALVSGSTAIARVSNLIVRVLGLKAVGITIDV